MKTIPIEELVHRRVYELQSRNLLVGVWNEQTRGFIGIRLKFGEEYLFTEYLNDSISVTGTATPMADLEVDIPDGVELEEYFTKCDVCRSGLSFEKDTGWTHVQPLAAVVCDTPRAIAKVNEALYDILKVERTKVIKKLREETGPPPTKQDLSDLEREREVTWNEVAPPLTEEDLKEI